MALSDISEVDSAIMARLANDPTLQSYVPDGVFYDVAAPGSQAFVIVARIEADAEPMLDSGTAWESYLYLVKSVILIPSGASGAPSKAAAKRIHELMQNATINAPGYADMYCQRAEPVRYTEVDPVSDVRWQHRGGQYHLWLIPLEN